MSSERSAELSAQLNQSLEKALKSAQERWPPLEDEIKYLDREQEQLARLAKEKKLTLNLREGEQRIDELRQQAKALQAFIQRIESIPENEKSSGLHKLLERALLLEGEAEFDQAIRLYEQVLQASPEQSKVKTRLDKLKLGWETKGDQHKAARVFIYQTWPTLDVAGVHSQLDEARKALVVCQANGDKLTPLKLLRVNAVHTVNLTKQMETLKRKDSEDNRNRAKTLLEISQSLLRLHNDAATWVGMRKD
jgi:tetratricopeptide (TPR) repeat protein